MRFAALSCLLLLSACTFSSDPKATEAHIVAPGNFVTGSGVVTSVGVLRGANKSASKDKDPNLYRLFLRMDRGGAQSVDVDRSLFFAGDAVDLTNDGRVLRVTGTSFNDALRR
jgi:hypothetical protein